MEVAVDIEQLQNASAKPSASVNTNAASASVGPLKLGTAVAVPSAAASLLYYFGLLMMEAVQH